MCAHRVAPRMVGGRPRTFEGFVVAEGVRKSANRELLLVSGFHTDTRFRSFTDSMVNVQTALLERVFYVQDAVTLQFSSPFSVEAGSFRDMLSEVYKYFRRSVNVIAPESILGYPERHYRGRRLRCYQNALENLQRRGVLRSDAYLSTFLKHEKVLNGNKRAVPRVIQPRRPEYNIAVGVYLRPIEERLYKRIATLFGHETVMKGKNVYEIGMLFADAWDSFEDPVALGLDASRFDQHVSVDALQWEHSIYDLYYRDPELRRLLEFQLRNKGFASTPDGSVTYEVNGCRCSGDMNTGMGNCLLMCSMVWALLNRHANAIVGRTPARLFNNGDDCVIVGERSTINLLLPLVAPWFKRLGFKMKIEPIVDVLEKVVFCQMQPVYDGSRWRMVRDPRVSLTKDATITNLVAPTEASLSNHCNAIGDCGLSLTTGMPILQSYYSAMLNNTRRGKLVHESFYGSGFYQLSRGTKNTGPSAISNAARVSFCEAFDITPDVQIALEDYFARLPPVAFTIGDELSEQFPDLLVE